MKLKTIVSKYDDFIKKEGKDFIVKVKQKDLFFKNFFKKENLRNIDEGSLREFIKMLWSYEFWTNKDYLLEEMLKSGIDNIKKAFNYLVYSEEKIDERFDYVLKNVKMVGASALSEILIYIDNKRYPFWSRRTKEALLFLGYQDKILESKWFYFTGRQYENLISIMKDLLEKVQKIDPNIDDFLKLNNLIFFISSELIRKPQPVTIEEFDHDSVVDDVFELGDGLGFEVAKEVKIAPGCRVDVIWKSRVANLGVISYAFEVHNKGSMDSAILNLQKVLHKDASIQKVVIVSTNTSIEKFGDQIRALYESFRKKVGYFEISELNNSLESLKTLKENISSLGFMVIKE